MGNRRMGLGRMEALLEAVDRDLNLANSTLTDCIITTSAYATFTGGVQVTHAVLTPAASVSINKADHAGRILTIASTATANDEYVLPTAATVGESYRFVWSGVAADADDILFVAGSANGLTFAGGLLDFDTDEAGVAGYVIVYPGGDDDKLTLTNPQAFDITFTALTTTKYLVSGYAMSTDTASAFGDL
tara:strand:+ start:4564 stop:5130 length:567 start_codon:yes stop_codon:yes gene_type:complete